MPEDVSPDVIARAQRGSPADAAALYARFHPSVYRYLYYRTGDSQTAEDLTADVFLKMVQVLPAYRIGAIPFQAWLFQVARNLAIDHHRRANVHAWAPIDENQRAADPGPEATVELRMLSAELAQALSRLDEIQRDVLLLRFIEELPIALTAQVLHKSEDAIKALQRRALMALRLHLNHKEIDHG